MAEYTMDDIFEPVFLTLEEGDQAHRFKLRERTKKLMAQFDKMAEEYAEAEERREKAVAEGEDPSIDDAVAMLLDQIDLFLEPVSENGTRKHAKTILKRAYEGNEVGYDRLLAILEWCQQENEARLDPTQSRTRTGG